MMTRSANETSQRDIGRGRFDRPAGSRGDTQYFAGNSIPLPAGSLASPVPILKSIDLSQAILDGLAVVFGLFFLAALFGSLPLAVALMVLGVL